MTTWVPPSASGIALAPMELAARLRKANVGGSWAIDALAELAQAGLLHCQAAPPAYLIAHIVAAMVAMRTAHCHRHLPAPYLPTCECDRRIVFGWGRTFLSVTWEKGAHDEFCRPLLSAGWHHPEPDQDLEDHPRIAAVAGRDDYFGSPTGADDVIIGDDREAHRD